jgi:localization factor PodJL
MAARQGQPEAQDSLGVMYDNGYGVKKDYVLAYTWFDVAASQGNKAAARHRDDIANRMSPSQIDEGRELARECIRTKYK